MHRTSHRLLAALTAAFACGLPAQAPIQFGTNFYEFVPASGMTWQTAATAAASRTWLGRAGHLATITSAAENAFLAANFATYATTVGIWLGGQVDATGAGRWSVGPDAGVQFSQGQASVGGRYTNWGGIEPNNAPSFLWMNGGPAFANIGRGQWADDDNGVPSPADPVIGYLVEYETPAWYAYGSGCSGSNGTPALQAATAPLAGQPLQLSLDHLPTAPGLYGIALGFSDTTSAVLGALPFDLAPLGAPGCLVLCDLLVTDFRPHGGNSATYSIGMPAGPSAVGLVIFQQAYAFDALANPLGVTSSNAGRAVLQ